MGIPSVVVTSLQALSDKFIIHSSLVRDQIPAQSLYLQSDNCIRDMVVIDILDHDDFGLPGVRVMGLPY